ncbi:hypothetical protein [Oceanobacillus rekensis]|uniref:hypothetical protein n=1 Tax=Oceanobacillus rekensis TaxID=937927 RepID=UPI001594326C|nr:hypothetical protein [Oceanobacillus rekensis]
MADKIQVSMDDVLLESTDGITDTELSRVKENLKVLFSGAREELLFLPDRM